MSIIAQVILVWMKRVDDRGKNLTAILVFVLLITMGGNTIQGREWKPG